MFLRLFAFSFLAIGILSLPASSNAQKKPDPKKKVDPKKKWDLDGFVREVAERGANEQVKMVSEKMRELNPLFKDFPVAKIENSEVARISFDTTYVEDVSPIRAFAKLKELHADGATYMSGKLAEIAPLAGLKLEIASFNHNPDLAEITSLKGMPLTTLEFDYTKVSSLAPVEGMSSLEVLKCSITRVTSLKSLKGLKLKELHCSLNKGAKGEMISDVTPLHGMKLEKFSCARCAVTEFATIKDMPITHLALGETPPTDFSFLKHLPLKELTLDHTRFNERDGHLVKDKQITMLILTNSQIKDLLFVKEMPLMKLWVNSCTQLKDLQPLKGMKLDGLYCHDTGIKDLKPLAGMPLKDLYCYNTPVASLEPLKGMPLDTLYCGVKDKEGTSSIADLTPLTGAPLRILWCANTNIKDLKPLAQAPLVLLYCQHTAIKDLKPLAGNSVVEFHCEATKVVDLTPLKDLPKLATLRCDYKLPKDGAALRAIKSLTTLNGANAMNVLGK
jgi:Leucine-rich repeat (LRR) protein